MTEAAIRRIHRRYRELSDRHQCRVDDIPRSASVAVATLTPVAGLRYHILNYRSDAMTAPATNPLVDDRDVELILDEVLDVGRLLTLPHFAEHDRETCQMLIAAARDLARDVLFPAYRALDAEPPRLVDGRVLVHPRMRELYARMTDLGVVAAPRSHEVGGAQLPLAVLSLAAAYLMAANLSAYGYVGLTQGAAHLLEAFGNDELRASYMARMYRGEWTGTMALTEPQAGSSLADIATTAEPTGE